MKIRGIEKKINVFIGAVIVTALLFWSISINITIQAAKPIIKENANKSLQKPIEEDAVPGEVIIGFNSVAAKNLFVLRNNIKQENIEKIGRLNSYKVKLDNIQAQAFIDEKQDNIGVEYIEPNYKFYATTTPNDTYFSSQTNLKQMKAEYGWETTTGSAAKVIAILDTGVDYLHEDLDGKIWINIGDPIGGGDDDLNGYIDDNQGWDFVNDDNNPMDDCGHGTLVAGAAAAETNNSQGVAGVDWLAKIMNLKVLNSLGNGTAANIAEAIDYAAANGADIISMSLGALGPSATIETAVNDAFNNDGKVIVAASGNTTQGCVYCGNWGVNWPAKYKNVIAVGSIAPNETRSSFTCSGPELWVLAPGQSILTTRWTGSHDQYAYASGTSLSTPQVAGLASLIWAEFPTLTNAQVKNRIKNNADKVSAMGWSNATSYYGGGRVNLLRSLLTLQKGSASTIYLILDGVKKRQIKNMRVFNAWRFNLQGVETVADGIINGYATGNIVYRVTKSTTSPNIYLMDRGKKKWVKKMSAFNGWGFSANSMSTVQYEIMRGYIWGSNLNYLAQGPNGNTVLSQLGKKHRINKPGVFSAWGFKWSNVSPVSQDFLISKAAGKDLKRLTKVVGSANTFYMQNGYKRLITSPGILPLLGLSWSDLVTVSGYLLGTKPTGASL